MTEGLAPSRWTEDYHRALERLTIERDGLRRALDYAEQIIRSYEMDCRNLPQYLADNSAEGFCQGAIYRDAITDIEALVYGP